MAEGAPELAAVWTSLFQELPGLVTVELVEGSTPVEATKVK